MRAHVQHCNRLPFGGSVHHDRLVENRALQEPLAEFGGTRRDIPVILQEHSAGPIGVIMLGYGRSKALNDGFLEPASIPTTNNGLCRSTKHMSEWIGQSVRRVEDERLLKGQGSFLADIRQPGT